MFVTLRGQRVNRESTCYSPYVFEQNWNNEANKTHKSLQMKTSNEKLSQ